MKYIDKAVAWINEDKNGGKYLAVTLKDNFKVGDKLFLRKNTFKKPGEPSPDYRYSVKAEEEEVSEPSAEPSQESIDVANDIPF